MQISEIISNYLNNNFDVVPSVQLSLDLTDTQERTHIHNTLLYISGLTDCCVCNTSMVVNLGDIRMIKNKIVNDGLPMLDRITLACILCKYYQPQLSGVMDKILEKFEGDKVTVIGG